MTTEHELTPAESQDPETEEQVLYSRRTFLVSLGKWSKAVIAGAVLGGGLLGPEREAQAGWINRRGGGGAGWVNGGGGGWVNRYGGGGAGWINGGGGGWVNRRGGWGGGSWVNRY
ncbi:MAG: hypothetical protein U1F76_06485 [Candidatus Competibacteraceae bacterium]